MSQPEGGSFPSLQLWGMGRGGGPLAGTGRALGPGTIRPSVAAGTAGLELLSADVSGKIFASGDGLPW